MVKRFLGTLALTGMLSSCAYNPSNYNVNLNETLGFPIYQGRNITMSLSENHFKEDAEALGGLLKMAYKNVEIGYGVSLNSQIEENETSTRFERERKNVLENNAFIGIRIPLNGKRNIGKK